MLTSFASVGMVLVEDVGKDGWWSWGWHRMDAWRSAANPP